MPNFLTKIVKSLIQKILARKNCKDKSRIAATKSILSGNLLGKKYHVANGVSLSIKNEKTSNDIVNESEIEKIAKEYISQPEKLFEYIKSKGTPVYVIKYANKILSLINENEGFILPQKGIKALYLNLILNKKISTKTQEIFVIRSYNTVECALLYQFYNWHCFKTKVSGYETETQNKFKNVFKICSSAESIESLSFEDILTLKTAVQRDIEAIDFVKKYISQNSKSKEKLKKILMGKLVKI